MKVMILAGGKGSRLWPLSSDKLPKQFLKIGSNESLLVETVKRLLSFCSKEEIGIVTNSSFASLAKCEIEKHFNFSPIIIEEPISKNTGFAVFYSVMNLLEQGRIVEDEPILFCPSDHHFTQVDELAKCVQYFRENGCRQKLYLFGVKPTRPETGFGYISLGNQVKDNEFEVRRFHEKPSFDSAISYLKKGNTLWNTGIFLVSFRALQSESSHIDKKYYSSLVSKNYTQLPSISFDHLVLEKSKNVHVFSLNMDFKDIGSFDALYSHLEKDQQKNSSLGDVHFVNSSRNLVISDKCRIGLVDVDDLIVANSHDGICITKRGSSQKVSLIRSHFKKSSQLQLSTIDSHPSYQLQKLILLPNSNFQFKACGTTEVKVMCGKEVFIFGKSLALHDVVSCEGLKNIELENKGSEEAILHLFSKQSLLKKS
ncbi:MAG: sugar phosphate nucleotidyltransferase [Rhabdochlamydiaceae bacterium]|nr:sugar phosphate nucleotidyltransferase [Candidatus Amphrikana amoebophyrae]